LHQVGARTTGDGLKEIAHFQAGACGRFASEKATLAGAIKDMRNISEDTVNRFVRLENVREKNPVAAADVCEPFPCGKIVSSSNGGTGEIREAGHSVIENLRELGVLCEISERIHPGEHVTSRNAGLKTVSELLKGARYKFRAGKDEEGP